MNTEITTTNEVVFFELEKVRFIIKDSCQLDIAYAYEDLVFSEHAIFVIQFNSEDANSLLCWFNVECIDTERFSIFKALTTSAQLNNMTIIYRGKFEMVQKEGGEEIDVQFTPFN